MSIPEEGLLENNNLKEQLRKNIGKESSDRGIEATVLFCCMELSLELWC